MDALQKANKDMNILFNITNVLMQCLRYHQIYTYACTVLAYLRDCLIYTRLGATHTHNGLFGYSYDQYTIIRYTPCARTQNYAQTHKSQPTSILHLPISLEHMLHLYCYFKTHVLVADGQFYHS